MGRRQDRIGWVDFYLVDAKREGEVEDRETEEDVVDVSGSLWKAEAVVDFISFAITRPPSENVK